MLLCLSFAFATHFLQNVHYQPEATITCIDATGAADNVKVFVCRGATVLATASASQQQRQPSQTSPPLLTAVIAMPASQPMALA